MNNLLIDTTKLLARAHGLELQIKSYSSIKQTITDRCLTRIGMNFQSLQKEVDFEVKVGNRSSYVRK